jgi:hypothetical protein
MKKWLVILTIVYSSNINAQIQITASDMPVVGDTLRSSATAPANNGGIVLANTGANYVWDYSSLTPFSQTVANYKSALAVNPLFGIISLSAYGYKVADSFPTLGIPLPVTIKDLYTFFSIKNSPSRFVAEGFGAIISGIPTPAAYTDEDEVYKFPLEYGVTNDSTTFDLKFNLTTLGSIRQKGYRKTTVDGWGTIKTPYFTTAVNCIRVRSEIREIDSVKIGPLPAVGVPRNSVEYKWLATGERYPVLLVTANLNGSTETITSVRYRDIYRPGLLSITEPQMMQTVSVYPNPSDKGILHINLPANWHTYTVQVYDVQGRVVKELDNTNQIETKDLANGNYLLVVNHQGSFAYAMFTN